MAEQILGTHKQKIASLELVPASGGCFELTANGKLLYSKLQTGEFPKEREIVDLIGKQLG